MRQNGRLETYSYLSREHKKAENQFEGKNTKELKHSLHTLKRHTEKGKNSAINNCMYYVVTIQKKNIFKNSLFARPFKDFSRSLP